uniref:Uncharacterized protein n=1 Tax=Lepeophtheirus salmonis TaxID=72036 RepID=A0A0K2U0Z4_LEPSM
MKRHEYYSFSSKNFFQLSGVPY